MMLIAQKIKQNSAITLALVVGMSLSNQSLHAKWTTENYAEVATAALRGVCSSIEHGLRKNNTTSAHFKRLLISASRIVHDILMVKNHPTDYHFQGKFFGDEYFSSAYLDGCLPSDAIDGVANLITLVESLIEEEELDLPARDGFVSKPLDFVQYIMLPAIESSAALYIAISNDITAENQKNRFVAKKILTLSSACHNFLNQGKGSSKHAAGIIILIHIMHVGYQLKCDTSDFNRWLAKKVHDERLPHQPPRQPHQPPQGRQQPQPLDPAQREAQRAQALAAFERRQRIV